MRATTAAAVLALTAASATAQSVGTPLDIARNLLNLLSPECRAVVSNLTQSSSPVYQCLQVDSLLPALLTNGSVIPPVDDYLSAVCYNDPCSQSLMNSTAQTIIEGCSADLDTFNVPNSTVYEVVGAYPLAREIACLKTTEPESFDNATIPINSTSYNSTNGTFCVTDLATDLSAYLGVNLTNNYIDSLALGANVTALQAVTAIPPTALCSDCVYAALDLIYTEYPQFGNITVDRRNNVTINSFLNQTCSATEDGFDVSNNGTLPDTIIPSADNSTFSATIVAGNVTYTPETATANVSSATASVSGTATIQTTTPASPVSSVSAALTSAVAGAPSAVSSAAAGITARGQMAEKRRWFGA